jgi:hypothetical protein
MSLSIAHLSNHQYQAQIRKVKDNFVYFVNEANEEFALHRRLCCEFIPKVGDIIQVWHCKQHEVFFATRGSQQESINVLIDEAFIESYKRNDHLDSSDQYESEEDFISDDELMHGHFNPFYDDQPDEDSFD